MTPRPGPLLTSEPFEKTSRVHGSAAADRRTGHEQHPHARRSNRHARHGVTQTADCRRDGARRLVSTSRFACSSDARGGEPGSSCWWRRSARRSSARSSSAEPRRSVDVLERRVEPVLDERARRPRQGRVRGPGAIRRPRRTGRDDLGVSPRARRRRSPTRRRRRPHRARRRFALVQRGQEHPPRATKPRTGHRGQAGSQDEPTRRWQRNGARPMVATARCERGALRAPPPREPVEAMEENRAASAAATTITATRPARGVGDGAGEALGVGRRITGATCARASQVTDRARRTTPAPARPASTSSAAMPAGRTTLASPSPDSTTARSASRTSSRGREATGVDRRAAGPPPFSGSPVAGLLGDDGRHRSCRRPRRDAPTPGVCRILGPARRLTRGRLRLRCFKRERISLPGGEPDRP